MSTKRVTLTTAVTGLALAFGLLLTILGTDGGVSDRIERAMAASGGDRLMVTRRSAIGNAADVVLFTEADLAAVKGLPGIQDVAGQKPMQHSAPVSTTDAKTGEKTYLYPIQYRRVTDNFLTVMGLSLAQGQSFTTADAPRHLTPAVIGAGMQEDLNLQLGSVITRPVWMDGALVVVGILNRTGDARPFQMFGIHTPGEPDFLSGIDYTAYVPYSSPLKVFYYLSDIHSPLGEWPPAKGMELVVSLKAEYGGRSEKLAEDVLTLLRSRGYGDAVVSTPSSLRAVFTRVKGNVANLLLYVALLALFLGSVNVANLNLLKQLREAHVTGVRRAIGASRGRIVWGVLWRSLGVALLGGGLGQLVGVGLQRPMSKLIGQKTHVTLLATVGGFAILAVVTLISSIYPAFVSVNQSPSVAIRWGALGVGKATLGERVRRLMAGLGVGVGVAAVTLVIALGHGTQLDIQRYLRSTGQDLLIVREADPFEAKGKVRGVLEPLLIAQLPAAVGQQVASMSWQERVQVPLKGATKAPAWIVATDPGFAKLSGLELAAGGFLTGRDVNDGAAVAVLGANIAEELGIGVKSVGSEVEVLGRKIRVVGILKPRAMDLLDYGADRDRAIYLPYTFVEKAGLLSASQTTKEIWISCLSGKATQVSYALDRFLGQEYQGFAPPTMVTPAAALSNLAAVQRDLAKVLTVLALIALTVGAFGITSFMFVRVSEAAPYIGIRRAVGATRPAIARAYLDEAFRLAGVRRWSDWERLWPSGWW